MESPTDLLLLPLLLTFFGALVYGLMIDGGIKRHKLAASRWIGIALIALGLCSGFGSTWQMTDSFTRQALGAIGKKAVVCHYLAGLLPLIVLLVCLGIDFWARKRVKFLTSDL